MSDEREFVIYVRRGNLLVELPSYDYGTFGDPRLKMQKDLCEQIRTLVSDLQFMSGYEPMEINQRMTYVFRMSIQPQKMTVALKRIKDYLTEMNILLRIIYVNLRF